MFLSSGHIWQRRIVIAWSLFAGLAVLWDFSWCFVFKQLHHASAHGWRLLWVVYGRADDRYLSGDRYLVILEFLTGLGSLLNFYVVHELLRGTKQRACVALFAVSIMEMYGALIYFGSEALNHFANVDTASFVHTWVMFVGLNSLWLILPSWCIYKLLTQSAGVRAPPLRATAEEPR